MRKGLLCGHVKPLVAARSNSTFLPSGGVLVGRKLQGRDWERRCGGTLGNCKRATPWSQPRMPSHRGVICYRSDAFCQGSTTDPARPKRVRCRSRSAIQQSRVPPSAEETAGWHTTPSATHFDADTAVASPPRPVAICAPIEKSRGTLGGGDGRGGKESRTGRRHT